MNTTKQIIYNLGLEGWIFALTSLAAIVFSVLSFLGVLPFDEEQTSSIVIGAIGLLMAAVVAQTARRQVGILELKRAIGVAESQLLSPEEFIAHLVLSVIRANDSICDAYMSMHQDKPTLPPSHSSSFFLGWPGEYRKKLFQRVSKREIEFRRVQLIPNKKILEEVVFRLVLHDGYKYYIRYYEAPQEAIPIINVMSFDDERVF